MAYKQDKAFSTSKAGKKSGWCLQNIRLGYGIGSGANTAIEAWGKTQQHKDRSIPSGVAVPLFYTYLKDGHVNVRLSDGRIYSDGAYYDNLGDYESKHPKCHYVGWGESINGVRVISYVADPKPATGRKVLHLNKGTDTTFYKVSGGTFNIHAKDDTYDYTVLEDLGNKVRVNSVSGGGNGWIYLTYSDTGNVIPGRSIK